MIVSINTFLYKIFLKTLSITKYTHIKFGSGSENTD